MPNKIEAAKSHNEIMKRSEIMYLASSIEKIFNEGLSSKKNRSVLLGDLIHFLRNSRLTSDEDLKLLEDVFSTPVSERHLFLKKIKNNTSDIK